MLNNPSERDIVVCSKGNNQCEMAFENISDTLSNVFLIGYNRMNAFHFFFSAKESRTCEVIDKFESFRFDTWQSDYATERAICDISMFYENAFVIVERHKNLYAVSRCNEHIREIFTGILSQLKADYC